MSVLAVVVPGFALALGVLGVRLWISPDRRARRALRAPAIPSRSLAPGDRAKVAGTVQLLDRLVAPLTARRCAWWRVEVQERDGEDGWATVGRASEAVPFLVRDGSGQDVRVHPERASWLVEAEEFDTTGLLDGPAEVEREVLRRIGVRARAGRRYRFLEARLEADRRVSVLGVAALREVGGSPCLVLEAPEDGELLVSDRAETLD